MLCGLRCLCLRERGDVWILSAVVCCVMRCRLGLVYRCRRRRGVGLRRRRLPLGLRRRLLSVLSRRRSRRLENRRLGGIWRRRDGRTASRTILSGLGALARLQRLLCQMRRLPGQGRCLSVGLVPQLVVPLSAVDALQFALQSLVSVLLGPDLFGNLVAVRGIELGDELGDQVLVLEGFLDGGQARALSLSLGRAGDIAVVRVGVGGLLMLELSLQALEVEVAQGIGTEAAGLEVLVGGDVRVLLQQVGDADEDSGADAIGMEALEQQERLEVGVGRDASRHPPGVCSARAMGVGRDGSHGDEGRGRGRLAEADGHCTRLGGGGGRWARRAARRRQRQMGWAVGLMRKLFFARASSALPLARQQQQPPSPGQPSRHPITRVHRHTTAPASPCGGARAQGAGLRRRLPHCGARRPAARRVTCSLPSSPYLNRHHPRLRLRREQTVLAPTASHARRRWLLVASCFLRRARARRRIFKPSFPSSTTDLRPPISPEHGRPLFPYILTLQSPCGLYSRGVILCFLSPLPGPPALHETSLTIEPFACLFYYHPPLALAHKYIPSFPRQPRPSPEPLPHRAYYTPSAYCSSWLPHTLHSPPPWTIPTMAGSRTNVLNRELPRR